MFAEAGIELSYVNDEVLQYARQQVDNVDPAEAGK
jgi:exonuclease VII small subunit